MMVNLVVLSAASLSSRYACTVPLIFAFLSIVTDRRISCACTHDVVIFSSLLFSSIRIFVQPEDTDKVYTRPTCSEEVEKLSKVKDLSAANFDVSNLFPKDKKHMEKEMAHVVKECVVTTTVIMNRLSSMNFHFTLCFFCIVFFVEERIHFVLIIYGFITHTSYFLVHVLSHSPSLIIESASCKTS